MERDCECIGYGDDIVPAEDLPFDPMEDDLSTSIDILIEATNEWFQDFVGYRNDPAVRGAWPRWKRAYRLAREAGRTLAEGDYPLAVATYMQGEAELQAGIDRWYQDSHAQGLNGYCRCPR